MNNGEKLDLTEAIKYLVIIVIITIDIDDTLICH